MKPSIVLSAFVAAFLLASAFVYPLELEFSVQVDGIESRDVLKEGIKPHELTQLTVKTNDENVTVEKFEVVHARGPSPISRASITEGNTFDLSAFRTQAKAGDRIVLAIKSVVNQNKVSVVVRNVTLAIPVN